MLSNISLVSSALLLVIMTIVVQSIPIEKANEIVSAPSIDHKQADKQELLKSVDSVGSSSTSFSSTISSTTISSQSIPTQEFLLKQEKNDHKKKRNVMNNDQFNRFLNSENNDDESSEESFDFQSNHNNNKQTGRVLHTKIEETPVNVHDNADKPINTDDSSVFSEMKMTPNELTDIVRRRRNVKSNMESNQRHKRALSSYNLYDTDALYDPYVDLIEAQQYARPVRSFAPIYWYPNAYERTIRAALAPSFYESSEWPQLYSTNILNDSDDDDDNQVSLYDKSDDDDDEDDDDVTGYELNRYPILLQSANNPFDNLQLQQQYNTDDLPIDEDIEESLNDDGDNYEAQYRSIYENQYPYYPRYGSLDTYFE